MTDKELALARDCAEKMYADDSASQALGIAVEVIAPGRVRATMRVRDDMVNGHALCHGGLIFTLADTAFAFACNGYGQVTVAGSASIEFLAPAHAGDLLTATATETHRKGRGGIYDVRVMNETALVAVFRGRSVELGRPLLQK